MTANTLVRPAFSSRDFRDCMALFPTGVTVVTFLGPDGRPYGMTANGITSVSLDPPLLLVCVAKTARSHGAALAAESFVVHILGSEHRELSALFASSRADKFDGIPWSLHQGAPALDAFVARLACRRWATYPGGDHSIVVGEVVDLDTRDADAGPLVFHRGRYRELNAS